MKTKLMFVGIIAVLSVCFGCTDDSIYAGKPLTDLAESCANRYVIQEISRGCPIIERIEWINVKCQEKNSTRGMCQTRISTSSFCHDPKVMDLTFEIYLKRGELNCDLLEAKEPF